MRSRVFLTVASTVVGGLAVAAPAHSLPTGPSPRAVWADFDATPEQVQNQNAVPADVQSALLRVQQGQFLDSDRALLAPYSDLADAISPKVSTPGSESQNSSAVNSFSGESCITWDTWVTQRSAWSGSILYRWHHNIDFCYNGSKVTRVRSERHSVSNKDWSWADKGENQSSKAAGGYSNAQGYIEGNMEQCFFHYGCVKTNHPAIGVTIYSNGKLDMWGTKSR